MLVGNAAAFAPQLRGVGFGTFETIELDDLDLTAADFKTGRRGQAARRRAGAGAAGRARERQLGRRSALALSAGAAAAGRPSIAPRKARRRVALLDRVIAAKGGLEKLRAHQDASSPTTDADDASAGRATSTVETTTYLQYPESRPRRDEAPDGTIVQVLRRQAARG